MEYEIYPEPFEVTNPVAAQFLHRVYLAGGVAQIKGRGKNRLAANGCDAYGACPCGSGKKVKFCHPQFSSQKVKRV